MRVPMPSPNKTNFAKLYIDVPTGLAMDSMPRWAKASVRRGLARDDFTPEPDPIAVAVTDLLNFLKTAMVPDQYKKAELLSDAVTTASRKLIAEHRTELNRANSASSATDDEGSEGSAYPPKATGSLSMDASPRRSWAKPDTSQADSHKRMLKNMARIGVV